MPVGNVTSDDGCGVANTQCAEHASCVESDGDFACVCDNDYYGNGAECFEQRCSEDWHCSGDNTLCVVDDAWPTCVCADSTDTACSTTMAFGNFSNDCTNGKSTCSTGYMCVASVDSSTGADTGLYQCECSSLPFMCPETAIFYSLAILVVILLIVIAIISCRRRQQQSTGETVVPYVDEQVDNDPEDGTVRAILVSAPGSRTSLNQPVPPTRSDIAPPKPGIPLRNDLAPVSRYNNRNSSGANNAQRVSSASSAGVLTPRRYTEMQENDLASWREQQRRMQEEEEENERQRQKPQQPTSTSAATATATTTTTATATTSNTSTSTSSSSTSTSTSTSSPASRTNPQTGKTKPNPKRKMSFAERLAANKAIRRKLKAGAISGERTVLPPLDTHHTHRADSLDSPTGTSTTSSSSSNSNTDTDTNVASKNVSNGPSQSSPRGNDSEFVVDGVRVPEVTVGSRVVVNGCHSGVVKFLGPLKGVPLGGLQFAGVLLDLPEGTGNGSFHGIQYFEAPPLHSVFVSTADLELDETNHTVLSPHTLEDGSGWSVTVDDDNTSVLQ